MPPLSYRLAAFYGAHFIQAGFFMAYFPLYLAARGFSAMEIAWVLALPQIMRSFAPAFWGALADRTGALRGLVALSCAAAAAGFAALPFSESFAALAWVVAVSGFISAGALPLVEAITLGVLAGEPGRYGPIRMWGSVGFIGAVLAGGAWLEAAPVAHLAWLLCAFALAALVVALTFPGGGGARAHGTRSSWRLSGPGATLLGCGFCMAAAHGTLYAFFTLHLERLGYRLSTIGVLWSVGVLAEVAVFLYLPQIFRRFSLSSVLAASFACAVLRFLLLGWLAGSAGLLVLAQLLHGATFGAFHAAALAAVQRVFPEGAQARGQTLFSSVTYGAGAGLGAALAGVLWQAGGAGLAFSASALAGLAGLHLARTLKRAGV